MNSSNINIPKKILDRLDPDEKVVYVAEGHWFKYFLCLFCFLIFILRINIILSLVAFISFLGMIIWISERIIITNKRILPITITSKYAKYLLRLPYTFDNIKYASSYENILGMGTLHLEHKDPKKIFMNHTLVKNVKSLEFAINEQLRVFNYSIFNCHIQEIQKDFIKTKSLNSFKIPIISIVFVLIQVILFSHDLKNLGVISLLLFSIYYTFNRMLRKH